MCMRPTSKSHKIHLRYWVFKAHRLVPVSDFLKWFQSDLVKHRLKLELFLVLRFLFIMNQKIGESYGMALPRVLFLEYVFFKVCFDLIFRNFILFGHFCFLRNKMLCPGNRSPPPGGAVPFPPPPPVPPPRGGGAYKFPGFGSRLGEGKGEGKPRCSNTPQDPRGVGGY